MFDYRSPMRPALLLLFSASIVGGCVPRTGDTLVDEVAAQVAPFRHCLRVGQTQIFTAVNEMGPPALLTPKLFMTPKAQSAAEKVAGPWQTARHEAPRFFGVGSPDNCATTVNAPVISDGFAFLTYSDPGGVIGAFAFQRQGSDWKLIEKIQLGFW
ncbi:hypothetical protein ACOYW6_12780 [Parablastomonas sp. CN1-191]|uniref:hypothetical protein n=1 Tax=Parablastomonas sp. CN1-191 TaxID=3400908 RepID=UPI003BF7B017